MKVVVQNGEQYDNMEYVVNSANLTERRCIIKWGKNDEFMFIANSDEVLDILTSNINETKFVRMTSLGIKRFVSIYAASMERSTNYTERHQGHEMSNEALLETVKLLQQRVDQLEMELRGIKFELNSSKRTEPVYPNIVFTQQGQKQVGSDDKKITRTGYCYTTNF